jgi:hypothetical protein
MKYLIGIIIAVALTGCATPQQNAALAGAVIGAAVATSVAPPPPPQPRPMRCYTQYIGYDAWHRPVYQQVCR